MGNLAIQILAPKTFKTFFIIIYLQYINKITYKQLYLLTIHDCTNKTNCGAKIHFFMHKLIFKNGVTVRDCRPVGFKKQFNGHFVLLQLNNEQPPLSDFVLLILLCVYFCAKDWVYLFCGNVVIYGAVIMFGISVWTLRYKYCCTFWKSYFNVYSCDVPVFTVCSAFRVIVS